MPARAAFSLSGREVFQPQIAMSCTARGDRSPCPHLNGCSDLLFSDGHWDPLRPIVGGSKNCPAERFDRKCVAGSFISSSVNVVNPQPVWLRSSISVVPSTRFETISSPRTSSVTAGPPVRITSISAIGRPRIPGRSETRGSMQVTTTILGAGCFPSVGL